MKVVEDIQRRHIVVSRKIFFPREYIVADFNREPRMILLDLGCLTTKTFIGEGSHTFLHTLNEPENTYEDYNPA